MNAQLRKARLQGTHEAARLHKILESENRIKREGGRVDVFRSIVEMGLPLIFRPLDALLGAYLPEPIPGVIVTTERVLSLQRFTGAHELGHFLMKHKVSLDGEEILRRSPFASAPYDAQEVAADAFAAEFLMPRWLFIAHALRQQWHAKSMRDPLLVYQMSLRVGASYEATARTLARHKIIGAPTSKRLLAIQPKRIKQGLLEGYEPEDWRSDVWLLTEKDEGAVIEGGPNDLFIATLREHSAAGYLWNIDELRAAGFAIVKDDHRIADAEQVGAVAERHVAARSTDSQEGSFVLREMRPWDHESAPITELHVAFDLQGREQGLSRVERKQLEAA